MQSQAFCLLALLKMRLTSRLSVCEASCGGALKEERNCTSQRKPSAWRRIHAAAAAAEAEEKYRRSYITAFTASTCTYLLHSYYHESATYKLVLLYSVLSRPYSVILHLLLLPMGEPALRAAARASQVSLPLERRRRDITMRMGWPQAVGRLKEAGRRRGAQSWAEKKTGRNGGTLRGTSISPRCCFFFFFFFCLMLQVAFERRGSIYQCHPLEAGILYCPLLFWGNSFPSNLMQWLREACSSIIFYSLQRFSFYVWLAVSANAVCHLHWLCMCLPVVLIFCVWLWCMSHLGRLQPVTLFCIYEGIHPTELYFHIYLSVWEVEERLENILIRLVFYWRKRYTFLFSSVYVSCAVLIISVLSFLREGNSTCMYT